MKGAATTLERGATLPRPLRVLLVEDDADEAARVVTALRHGGLDVDVVRVSTLDGVRDALGRRRPDVVLAGGSLSEAPALVREAGLDVPFVSVAGEHACDEARLRARLARSEEVLERSERLRALGQMAAGISHDLKNVLVNPLGLQLQLAERALARGDTARVGDVIVAMRSILEQGLAAIERLRHFSRPGPERGLERVTLDGAVREAVEMSRARVRPGNGPIEIVADTANGRRATVAANPAEIVAALVNLIVNAIDAMPDGGTIAVTTGTDGDGAWVEVADDGPGMSDEVKARAFEPFFTTKGDDGTGIGLAMVFACVHRHGGHVTLDTAPGRGARFRLWFPATRHAASPVAR